MINCVSVAFLTPNTFPWEFSDTRKFLVGKAFPQIIGCENYFRILRHIAVADAIPKIEISDDCGETSFHKIMMRCGQSLMRVT
jgi:hypothetical protein